MTFKSSIWGPTCDGLDKILEEVELPELEDGDWIYFKDMGSYTLAAGSCFNGIPKPRVYYIAEVNLPGWDNNNNEDSLIPNNTILKQLFINHQCQQCYHIMIWQVTQWTVTWEVNLISLPDLTSSSLLMHLKIYIRAFHKMCFGPGWHHVCIYQLPGWQVLKIYYQP